ncbi:MAG: hypothetical protein GTN81_05930 [Proteobacteria bacterium]|nr:hypothetical protein [Pseudomonadota bacterium]
MILFEGFQKCVTIIDLRSFGGDHADREVQCVCGNMAMAGGKGVATSLGSLTSMVLVERVKNRIVLVSSGQGRNVKEARSELFQRKRSGGYLSLETDRD